MTKNDRANFGSKLGVILASAGSAVGLGNIWRFPYETGNHGGAAFILIYLGCILLLGLPIMIAEFLIGRHSQANTARAYQKLAPGTHWRWVGRMGVLAGFLILSYYAVVAGWTLEYILEAATNGFSGKTSGEFITSFQQFSSNPWRPVIWLIAFLLITHFIIVKGVEKGIEKSSKIMMPTLFIIIVILVVCSVTLPGAGAGIKFLLKPDFSKVDGNVFLSAMGQAFFSLSLGMGCLCTYASYFSKETNLTKTAFSVGIIDTFVAILAGFIIFPAAFSVGIQPDSGPSLIFITLPNVFQQAFGGVPILAYIFSVMFYALLAMAALTSTISLHEVVTAYLHEEFNLSRGKAARLVTGGCIFLGIFCSLSLGVTKGFTIFGLGMFDLFDFVTAKIMLPLGGLCISLFTGWYLDKKIVWSEITNNGSIEIPVYKLIIFILKYIAPIAISLIFINELGLIKLSCGKTFFISLKPNDKALSSDVYKRQPQRKFAEGDPPKNDSYSPKEVRLSIFDPNTADSITFISLGLPPWIAKNILRYRKKQGKFRHPEDFQKIYGLTDEQYQTLHPYIRITEQSSTKDTVRLLMKQRMPQDTLFKYQPGTVINLNEADTTELKKVPGIGSAIARMIVNYRTQLGGFYKIEQLQEKHLKAEMLRPWFSINATQIRRININKASIERMMHHPYINYYQAKVIVEYRKKKGILTNLKQLSLYEEFNTADFERITPYICYE